MNGMNTLSLPEVIVIVPSRIFPVVFSETSYLIVELPAFPDFDLDDSVIQSESDSAVQFASERRVAVYMKSSLLPLQAAPTRAV